MWARQEIVPAEQLLPPIDRAAQHYVSFDSLEELKEYLSPITGPKVLVSAHRGGPEPGFPENCLETFENSLRHGPLVVEFDVKQTGDRHLILMHDDTVDRTTNGEGRVDEMTLSDLRKLRLRDADGVLTKFRVPTLEEALAWGRGRVILTLDIKRGVDPDLLVETVRRMNAETFVTLIVYSLEDAEMYAEKAPGWVIAASASNIDMARELLSGPTPHSDWNVFTGVGQVRQDVLDVLRNAGVRSIMGTFGEIDERAKTEGPDVYLPIIEAGVGMIATDNVAVASVAARRANAAGYGSISVQIGGERWSSQRVLGVPVLLRDFDLFYILGTNADMVPVESDW